MCKKLSFFLEKHASSALNWQTSCAPTCAGLQPKSYDLAVPDCTSRETSTNALTSFCFAASIARHEHRPARGRIESRARRVDQSCARAKPYRGDKRRSDVVDPARTCDKIKLRQIDGRRAPADFADEDRWSDSAGKNRDYERRSGTKYLSHRG